MSAPDPWQPDRPGSPYGPAAAVDARTDGKAVAALVLAVLAYTPTVPFIGAVVAILLARSARRGILASGGTRTGLGLCTAATVLSWVHLALLALLLAGVVLLLVLGVSLS